MKLTSNEHYAVRTGKSSLTQRYIGQVYKDGELIWQTKEHYDTPDEARRIANAALNELICK